MQNRFFHNIFLLVKNAFKSHQHLNAHRITCWREGFHSFSRLFIRGLIFSIGYLLSPLSWWNDLFVNVPLAYFFALLLSSLSGGFFAFWFSVGYTLSNVIGILLMKFSVSRYSGSWIRDLFYSIAYSVIAYIILSLFLS